MFDLISREVFNFNMNSFDEPLCKFYSAHGTRKYLMKQDDSTLDASRRKLNMFFILDKTVTFLFWAMVGYYLVKMIFL